MKPLVIHFDKDFSAKAGQSMVIHSRDSYGVCDTELWERVNGEAKKSAPVPEPPVEQEKIDGDVAAETVHITQAQIFRANGRTPASKRSVRDVANPKSEREVVALARRLNRSITMMDVVRDRYTHEFSDLHSEDGLFARRKATMILSACYVHGLLAKTPTSDEEKAQAKLSGVRLKTVYFVPRFPTNPPA